MGTVVTRFSTALTSGAPLDFSPGERTIDDLWTAMSADRRAASLSIAGQPENVCADYVNADWANGAEHQEWALTAPALEVGLWVQDCSRDKSVEYFEETEETI